ncbi:hypothetical protein DFJ74DRAFT_742107, partial [Hyaloraphidium curvatum]
AASKVPLLPAFPRGPLPLRSPRGRVLLRPSAPPPNQPHRRLHPPHRQPLGHPRLPPPPRHGAPLPPGQRHRARRSPLHLHPRLPKRHRRHAAHAGHRHRPRAGLAGERELRLRDQLDRPVRVCAAGQGAVRRGDHDGRRFGVIPDRRRYRGRRRAVRPGPGDRGTRGRREADGRSRRRRGDDDDEAVGCGEGFRRIRVRAGGIAATPRIRRDSVAARRDIVPGSNRLWLDGMSCESSGSDLAG